ncbi:HC-toxin efflux carrier TOXA [Tolypocladium capitatum]|uniref:HC-toxin efflux carrier TOXA n=1 Tax=Tolypocladium capitatum TaxID=45235 RepID=A0A2K3Q4J4_9HYPO|nr:HC-toxin efflux carrier TOXA [Tolypocladium capitatum]
MAAASQYDSGEKTLAEEARARSPGDAEEAATDGEKKDVEAGAAAADQTNYPGPLAAGLLMLAICVAVFLVSLDRTVVATAIPRITDEFNSFGDIGWYAGAYALSGCAMQLPLGRFYSFYPPKVVFVTLLFVFIVGSAVGAGAPNSATVIVGRAIQGVGCAGVFSGSIILLMDNVPLQRRPMFVGAAMATMSISSIIGPLIGGALTSNATWRWCFIINIPLSMATIAVVYFTVKHTPGREGSTKGSVEKLKHLDPLGALFLIPAVISLVLALQWGGAEYAWQSWRIVLLLVLSGVLAIAFATVQVMMPDTATVAPRVICQRSVASSLLFSTCSGGAMMVVVYWIPIWFQAIKNASPVQSGEMTIPLLLSQALASIAAGGLVSKVVGYAPPFMLASSVMMSIGAGLLTTLKMDSGHSEWIGYQILFGFGLGFGMQQSSNSVQAILDKTAFNSAISLFFFGMQLGGSVCVCIGQNVLNQRLIQALKDAAIPGLDPYAVLHTGATQLGSLVHTDADLAMLQFAYNHSLTSVFYVAVAVAALSLFGGALVEWRSIKGSDKKPFED